MSAGRDAWKAWNGASLLDHTKLKKETEPYVARELIYTVARGLITQHGTYVWRAVALVTCRHGATVVSTRNKTHVSRTQFDFVTTIYRKGNPTILPT